jgi:tetratricopeptide (TPR) repeat protein
MRNTKRSGTGLWVGLAVAFAFSAPVFGAAPVRVWEEPLVLPTYAVGKADTNPRFYAGRAYQGAQGRVYPYAMIDVLTDDRKDVSYKAAYLENEYIKLCVLPELGGRLLYATDKTNNYEFFYRQHVVKPALVGMLGAWVEGGIEWNFPHHHRPSVYMPIDYTLQKNPDGSATVWIGEIEIRHRMKWTLGLTLHPGKSYVEATVKLINRTPFTQSFLFFANASVHANPDYQVLFPPATEFATYHGKNQFAGWPISREVFNGKDYTSGVDVSWWKNHPDWISMFAWNYEDDFFGGYDHAKRAGIVSFANHHVAPGKKFWEWSPSPRGQLWDQMLTDADGPALELMTGVYADNQPDYSWLQPYESKVANIYWYPIRELKGLKNANLEAALNMDVKDQTVWLAFNTVQQYQKAIVRLYAGSRIVHEQTIDIGPDRPFTREVPRPAGVPAEELRAALFSADGKELVAYSPRKPENSPMPPVVEPPPPPEKIATVEELYLTGLRLEQFFNPVFDPEPYYTEALRRDPGDYRVNVAVGIRHFKRGMFEEAETCFRKAIDRATRNYTSPRDGEAFYYLGTVLKSQGKLDEAYTNFYKAAWSYGFHSAAYTQLAEIDCGRRQFTLALDHINRSIATNNWSTHALNLKTALLRKLNRVEEAARLSEQVRAFDPLDFWAGYEGYLSRKAAGAKEAAGALRELQAAMRGDAQSYLELAVDYGNAGLLEDAVSVIQLLMGSGDSKSISPMAKYYLGYYLGRLGDETKELSCYREAAQAAPDYGFPSRLEAIGVLHQAIRRNPSDARAHYYLGNLLYDLQPEVALKEWERSRALDGSFGLVHRNLAIAYEQVEKDVPKAVAALETALSRNAGEPRWYYELDVLYEKAGTDPEKRMKRLLDRYNTVAERDDSLSRVVLLWVLTGEYDKALELMKNRHFHNWEGSGGLRNAFEDAYLLRGLKAFSQGQHAKALSDYRAALEFPVNLENAWPYRGGRIAEIYYFAGTAHEALGETGKAQECYRNAINHRQSSQWSAQTYFQAMALKRLGESAKAEELLAGLLRFASGETSTGVGFFAKFGEQLPLNVRRSGDHYLRGLAQLGMGDKDKARSEMKTALELDVNNIWARTQLSLIR